MKKIAFVFCILTHFLLAQDQIILRKTGRAIEKELEIKRVAIDSIIYLPQGSKSIKALPIGEIIAYRKGYEMEPPFIFPDAEDKELYSIKNGRAIDKNMPAPSTGDMKYVDLNLLLRPHKITEEYDEDSLVGNNLVMFKKINSTRCIVKRRKTKMYIILKSDPDKGYGNRIVLKNYKFTTDSMLFFEHRNKKESDFYAVRFADLRCVGIQTPGTIVAKLAIGLIELPFVYGFWLGINTMIRPMYRKLNVENKWEIIVAKDIKKR